MFREAQAVTACAWCRRGISATARADSRFCSRKCRQAAWRLRRYVSPAARGPVDASPETSPGSPRRLAYADPPYPDCAARYYRHHPDYGGEVDHASLLDRLATYDGWALSTSARALRELLPMCPADVRLCAWIKPKNANQSARSFGLHNVWEAIIVKPARRLRPGVPDGLTFDAARLGGSDLIGRKPLQFCAWLFRALGSAAGDTFDDLFPGSGIVGDAWREYQASLGAIAAGDASPLQLDLVSFLDSARDASPRDPDDASSVPAPAPSDGKNFCPAAAYASRTPGTLPLAFDRKPFGVLVAPLSSFTSRSTKPLE